MIDVNTCPTCGFQAAGKFCPKCGVRMSLALEAAEAQAAAQVVVNSPPQPVRTVRPPGGSVAPTSVAPGGVMGRTDGVAFTDKVHDVLGQAREELVWQGSPSLVLMVGLWLRYGFLLALLTAAAIAFPAFAAGAMTFGAILLALCLLQTVIRFLKLRGLKYRVSTERIEVASGVLSKSTHTYEAHQAKDISIYRPFPISLLGAANVAVYASNWSVTILGVPVEHSEAIRDAIRESGRREGARVDLIQWRN